MPKDAGEPGINPELHPGVFPLRVTSVRPLAVSADCAHVARCVDRLDYVVKDTLNGKAPFIPHSEWFCSELSDAIQIPSPPHRVLQMPTGERVFGSRWQGGVMRPEIGGWWFERVGRGEIDFGEISSLLSQVYAFDQFIHNIDRHAGNFVFHDQHEGYACLPMDYSRAWITHGFPLPPPPLPPCNTSVFLPALLKQAWKTSYLKPQVMLDTLSAIEAVPAATINRIIGYQAKEWLPDKLRDDIVSWWSSDAMRARIAEISTGVKNGLYG